MAIITIGFNPAIDRILECADFHIGGHQQARQVALLAAGKAANVNRALSQLGTDSIAMGFVGAEEMTFFHDQLMSRGPGRILCRYVEVAGQTRENISILDPKRRLETHLRDRGFAVTAREAALLDEKVSHELKPGDVVVIAGSLCDGLTDAYLDALLEKCRSAAARVVVDSSGPPLRAAAAHRLWLLKPNLDELRQLLGVEVPNAAAAIRDTAAPLLKTTENILVTRGPMGAVLLTPEATYSARIALKDVPIRTVGCGDYLLAGFLSRLTDTAPGPDGKAPPAAQPSQSRMEEALATAVAVATAAVSTTLEEFDPAMLRKALGEIVVERI